MTSASSAPVAPRHLIAALLSGPYVPPAAVRAAANLPAPWPLIAAASAPAGAADELLSHRQPLVRTAALRRSRDTTRLHVAAHDSAARTRAAAAANVHTPVDDLIAALADEEPSVVLAAAANPATPSPEVVATLKSRPIGRLVMPNTAAGYRNTSSPRLAAARAVLHAHPKALRVVAADADPAVRRAAAADPHIGKGVLATLRRRKGSAQQSDTLGANPFVPEADLPDNPSAEQGRERITPLITTPDWRGRLVGDSVVRQRAGFAGSLTVDALLLDTPAELHVVAAQSARTIQFPDGFTLATAVERLGFAGYAVVKDLSSVRLAAGEFASPLLAALTAARLLDVYPLKTTGGDLLAAVAAADEAGQHAGDNPVAWQALLTALAVWSGPVTAEQAVTLVAGITG